MIPLHDLKEGDVVYAEYEGQDTRGIVKQIDRETHQVCVVTNDDQESWYAAEEVDPVALTAEELHLLQFEPTTPATDGTVDYIRGPFTIRLAAEGDFSHLTLLYRSEQPRVVHDVAVHELQNHYMQMTNFHLA